MRLLQAASSLSIAREERWIALSSAAPAWTCIRTRWPRPCASPERAESAYRKRPPSRPPPRGLLTLADWLEGHAVSLVGMESTGCYWKPLYYVLEERFECWLLNAQHLRNVPGRKTDVADSAWICQLLE